MMKLTKKQILAMHNELINEHGGSDGLRDEGDTSRLFTPCSESVDKCFIHGKT